MNSENPSVNKDSTAGQTKGVDEKFCESCGEIIKKRAEICPKCGVRITNVLSKTALMLITFFLGGIGGHKFYLGKYVQAVFYLFFCWTGIPSIIALVEFIRYAITDEDKLQKKYASSNPSIVVVIIAFGIGSIFIIGILAALAIPKFVNASTKAKCSEIPTLFATYENEQLACITETGTNCLYNELSIAHYESKYFKYAELKPGTYTAEAIENIGMFPKGAAVSITIDTARNVTYSFAGTQESIVVKYLPSLFNE